MAQEMYAGEYAKFFATDSQGIDFMGADNLVGDRYSIDIRDEESGYRAYLVNRFGNDIGYLENRMVRPIQIAQAKGWETCAFLSFVAFTQGTDEDNPGYYWGQMAVMMYDQHLMEPMKTFEATLSKTMADGGRPQVDFGARSVESIISSNGTWFPTDKAAKPKMAKGSSIVKDHQTPNERLVEQSRKGNIGCYIASYAFIALIIVGILYGLHTCGVF